MFSDNADPKSAKKHVNYRVLRKPCPKNASQTTPKSPPQPPNFDECFGKSIQRVFSQLSFLIHCLIGFQANPPATVRFGDGDSRKNRRKKRRRNAPRNIAGSGGRAIKTSSKKPPKSFNQRFNDAPPNHRRSGGASENLGSKSPLIHLDF